MNKRLVVLVSGLIGVGACAMEQQPPPAAPPAAALPPAPPAAQPAPPPAPATTKEVPITSKSPEAVATYKQARELVENVRGPEAAPLLAKCIQLDPEFATAHAVLGGVTPGPEGMTQIEKALALSKNLPEAERLTIESLHAARRGDVGASIELQKKVIALAPGDARAHVHLGGALLFQRRFEESVAVLKKAVELSPSSGPAYNLLGYASVNQGKHDEAIAAFKKYAELVPSEPNPYDSLAEAYLMAGRFEESEAGFKKALEVSPKFAIAWQGIAQARLMRGDWAGGREALTKFKEAALRPFERVEAEELTAWIKLYEGKPADAAKAFEAAGKTAAEQKVGVLEGMSGANRAFALLEAGKAADAVKQVDTSLEMLDKANLPGEGAQHVKQVALQTKLLAQLKLGKAADVQKTAAQVEDLSKKSPAEVELVSAAHFARGIAAWAGGDAKAAVGHLSQCIPHHALCRWQLALAQEKAGDKAGAEATRGQIVATPRRDPVSVFARVKVGGIAKPKPEKAAPKTDKPAASKDQPAAAKPADKSASAKPADKATPAAKPTQPAAAKKP